MTCDKCLYQPICDTYANFGVTDLPVSHISPCKLFKNKADFVEVKDLSPCDVCDYNPPSSLDGKPCALCPATKKEGVIHNG